jgi:hypothetical protein
VPKGQVVMTLISQAKGQIFNIKALLCYIVFSIHRYPMGFAVFFVLFG